MKYFIRINIALPITLLILFVLFNPGIIPWLGIILLVIFFTPAIVVLDPFSVKTCTGEFGCAPTIPTIIVTLVFISLILYILRSFGKKNTVEQGNQISNNLYLVTAFFLLFNIGGVIYLTQSLVANIAESYKYRLQAFQLQLNQSYDFSDLNFSIKTPSDWVESKYKSTEYATVIPQKLEEKLEQFSYLVVSPSYSLVDTHYISTTIYEVISGYKIDLFCKGGGFKKSVFVGRSAEECIIDTGYEYGKLIRITDLSGLGPNWKKDNLIWFYLLNEHTNLAPLYENVLSTLEFQSRSNNSNVNINNQSQDNSSVQTTSQTGVFLASPNVINFSIKKGNIVEGSTKPEDFVMFTNDPFNATSLKSTHWKAVIVGNWINAATNGTAGLAYRVGINYHAYELPAGSYTGSITYSGDLGSELDPQTVTVNLVVEN